MGARSPGLKRCAGDWRAQESACTSISPTRARTGRTPPSARKSGPGDATAPRGRTRVDLRPGDPREAHGNRLRLLVGGTGIALPGDFFFAHFQRPGLHRCAPGRGAGGPMQATVGESFDRCGTAYAAALRHRIQLTQAFVAGTAPRYSVVVVTRGLLVLMDQSELEAGPRAVAHRQSGYATQDHGGWGKAIGAWLLALVIGWIRLRSGEPQN